EQAFAVEHFVVLARIVEHGRYVVETVRKGRGQTSTRIDGTGQNVGQRVAGFLAEIPKLHDAGDLVAPRHGHGSPGVEHDNGVRVGRGDGADEFFLFARQRNVLAVVALGLPRVVHADNHDGDVGVSRRG